MARKDAPFTDEEVKSINDFQKSGVFHEFTCVESHPGLDRTLVAFQHGLDCPHCAYTQVWVHSWMADRSWANVPWVKGANY